MSKKLLLADDSVTIQRVIELTFADEDVAVTAVGDGRQAIDRLRTDRPDIVLADVGMPERDGYEVASFIKNDPQLAHIPVILLTGAFEPLDEERARSVGCDGVLVKPFEPQMVINRVKELLTSRRPAAPAVATVTAPPVAAVTAPPVRQAAIGEDLDAGLAPLPGAAEVKKTTDALEAYFDRLDAAFANMSAPAARGASAPVPAPASAPAEDLSTAISELHEPPPQRTPAEDPLTSWDPELSTDVAPAPQPHLASAFAALLAAEEGQPVAESAFGLSPVPRLGEDEIEQIVERVIARLTDETVRRTVIDTAERLVREEIERIKRHARTSGSGPQTGR
jgi:CheY-like chemotaxis protein